MVMLHEFLDGKDLFSAIAEVEPFPFLYVPGDAVLLSEDNEILNIILNIDYGKRLLFSGFEDLTINQIAQILVKKFKTVWYVYIQMELNSTKEGVTREVIKNDDGIETRTGEGENVNKVSSYNSDIFVNNDGSNNTSNDSLTFDRNSSVKNVVVDVKKQYEYLSLLSKDVILNNIMQDVGRSLTLNIY